MKLLLTKAQSKGLLGGVKFEVKAKVELTDEERELVRRYKLEDETLVSRKVSNMLGQLADSNMVGELTGGKFTGREVSITVTNLINGDTYKCKDLNEVMNYSDQLVDGCETLKAYLEVARGFGGEEVIEI